ncbi:MAG: hypothetical protein KDA77_09485 [Planctomycetaceae bacterium]|nr:hypothetical protein [Planctomycetaceae bacterium]
MKCLIPILIFLTGCSETERTKPADSSATVPEIQQKAQTPVIVRTGFKQIYAWRGAKDFQTDSDSNDYFVYQTLKAQLNCDQLQIRSADPVPGSLRYEAKCRGMRYLVQYDLNSVQIMKVIRE